MSTLPTRFAIAATAALSRASSRAVVLERREPFLVDVGCKHAGAFARKGDGAGAADSRRACGHECTLAF
jgi:hypothetical protein